MDRPTVEVYEGQTARWVRQRGPGHRPDPVIAFAARVAAARAAGAPALPVVDLGCGPGWDCALLPPPVVAVDAAVAMLREARRRVAGARAVQADLEALPFATGSLGGAWAVRSYVHVARPALAGALADLHRCLAVGAPAELHLLAGDLDHGALPHDDFPGRAFALWRPERLADAAARAGFTGVEVVVDADGPEDRIRVVLTRS